MPRRTSDFAWLAALVALLVGIGTTMAVAASRSPMSAPAAAVPPANAAHANTVVDTQTTVAPLRRIASPDALVISRSALKRGEVRRVRHRAGVRSLTVVDAAKLPLAGRRGRVLGVSPSQFRSFTPPPTAASDPLWQAVASGDLVVDYAVAKQQHLQLGTTIPVGGVPMRIGGFASLGLPRVAAVVARAADAPLGLRPDAGVVVSAPGQDMEHIRDAARHVIGQSTVVIPTHPEARPSDDGRPHTYLELYQAAATTCPGLSWTILAAIGQIESGHGVNVGPSSAGALGPMQFMPRTWQAYGVDADGDHVANIMDPFDAVYAAAGYLCANGAGYGGNALRNAIWHYNHATWYVDEVIGLAKLYG